MALMKIASRKLTFNIPVPYKNFSNKINIKNYTSKSSYIYLLNNIYKALF